MREPDHERAAALSTAILNLKINPEDWVDRWEGQAPPNWVDTVKLIVIAGLALPVELNGAELVKAYNGWLEQSVLDPLYSRSLKAYAAVVAHIRAFVNAVAEEDND